ncbi:MAG: polysaccharide biosynthesis/export family protein [Hyphomicrobiaceae bacterium]
MTESADPESRSYKIGPMDVLEVTGFKVSELSRSVQVSEAGSINFPLVGDMPAAGRTAGEVERDLTQRLGARYLQNPQVTVQVREFNSQRVTIEGSVKKPGVYPIQGRLTLLQALATAGGFTELATSTVVVFRTTDGQRAGARFDLDEIRAGTTPDPELKAGDVVVASDSSGKVAFENFAKVLPIARFFMLF